MRASRRRTSELVEREVEVLQLRELGVEPRRHFTGQSVGTARPVLTTQVKRLEVHQVRERLRDCA